MNTAWSKPTQYIAGIGLVLMGTYILLLGRAKPFQNFTLLIEQRNRAGEDQRLHPFEQSLYVASRRQSTPELLTCDQGTREDREQRQDRGSRARDLYSQWGQHQFLRDDGVAWQSVEHDLLVSLVQRYRSRHPTEVWRTLKQNQFTAFF
jgi:hypothetical protein